MGMRTLFSGSLPQDSLKHLPASQVSFPLRLPDDTPVVELTDLSLTVGTELEMLRVGEMIFMQPHITSNLG